MTNDGLRINEKNQVVLCGDKVCCPVMERLSDGRYRVIDDDGNCVIMTAEQINLMSRGAKKCDEISNQSVLEQQLICG